MEHMAEPAEELLDRLSALRRALRRRSERPEELSRLTGAQLELVRLLRRRPGTSVGEAAAELGLAPNTVSTLVGTLTREDVVVRTVDDADRRAVRLELAAPVRHRVEAWRDRRTDALQSALDELDPASRRRIVDALPVLDRLTALLEDR